MDKSYHVAGTRSDSRTRACSGITLLDSMIQSDRKCSLYCTTKYRMAQPLSDQLFRSMDAHVALLVTSDSNPGAEGTVRVCVHVSRQKSVQRDTEEGTEKRDGNGNEIVSLGRSGFTQIALFCDAKCLFPVSLSLSLAISEL